MTFFFSLGGGGDRFGDFIAILVRFREKRKLALKTYHSLIGLPETVKYLMTIVFCTAQHSSHLPPFFVRTFNTFVLAFFLYLLLRTQGREKSQTDERTIPQLCCHPTDGEVKEEAPC